MSDTLLIPTYTGNDIAINQFRLMNAAVKGDLTLMRLPLGGRVLEIGCEETDFLEQLQASRPDLDIVGLDWRANRRGVPGDAMNRTLFEGGYFDAVISLGTIEHIGLGYYGDPVRETGDQIAVQNMAYWAKRGAWLYFDVPYGPDGMFVSANRHWRRYDKRGVQERLLPATIHERGRLYTNVEGTIIPEPSVTSWPFDYLLLLCEVV